MCCFNKIKEFLVEIKNKNKKETDMNFNGWYSGLSKRLKEEGYDESSKTIDETIGEDGKGGVAKVIADYYQENPIDLGELTVPLTITIGEKRGNKQDFELSLNFSDNEVLNSIIIKVLMQAVLSAYLAGSYSK